MLILAFPRHSSHHTASGIPLSKYTRNTCIAELYVHFVFAKKDVLGTCKLIWTNVANSQNNKYVEFNILRFQHSVLNFRYKRLAQWGLYGLKLRLDCCVSCHTAFSQIKAPQAKISNNRPSRMNAPLPQFFFLEQWQYKRNATICMSLTRIMTLYCIHAH